MSPPEKPIVLVGMMGAGKTTVGRLLAAALDWDFVDSDRQVEIRAEKTITEIFAKDGEATFRALEQEVIEGLLDYRNTVIGAGGGALQNDELRSLISEKATSIWLKVAPDQMYQRTMTSQARPLLLGDNPRQSYMDLYEARKATYAKASIVIDTENASPDEGVRLILSALKQRTA